jgi:hypothetical protein
MPELQDDLLKDKTGYQVKVSEGVFSAIPQKNIEIVAGYLQLTVDVVSRKKEVDILAIFDNARKIFSDSYIKETDKLWKEHLASTLREPLDGSFDANIQKALRHLPKREADEDSRKFYVYIQEVKGFLNDLAHMRYEKVAKYVKDKYNLTETPLTEDTFNKICKDLIDTLHTWFCKHCYKET